MSKGYFFRSNGNFLGMDVNFSYDFKNKDAAIADYILYMLCRTQSMFKYDNLPDTIPARSLELYLQVNGNVCITSIDGSLYALAGGLGGPPNPYYMPTVYTIANPALNISRNLKIGEECIVIPSDSMYMGLLPMFRRYATSLAENDLTIRIADINTRITSLLTAPDDRTKKAAEKYICDIEKGELGVISENSFLDGIRSQPYSSSGHNNQITQLIELQQYLKAGWYNELGLNANYNMKRESINSNEAQLNRDSLLPLIDDMLKQRENGIKAVNDMYGTNILVSFASTWQIIEDEIKVSGQPEKEGSEDNVRSIE